MRKPWTWEDLEQMVLLSHAGYSTAHVARVLKRSRASVMMKASRMEIPFRGRSGAPRGNDNRRAGMRKNIEAPRER